MRATWSALYLQMVSHCNRFSSETSFRQIKFRQAELQQFASMAELLHHQNAPGGDTALRNAVLRALTLEAQADHASSETASTLLILALWPGLDAVRGRLCRDFPEARAEHGGDILTYMATASRKLDLGRVNRIAATLVMNAERDIRRGHVACIRRAKQYVSIETPTGAAALSVTAPVDDALPVHVWRDRLTYLLGRDATLFLRIIVLGETQQQAGAALGLSHDAARKRHQRGMAKLKAAANGLDELSHSTPQIGFYPSEARDADR